MKAISRRSFLKGSAAAASAASPLGAVDFIGSEDLAPQKGFSASHFGAFYPIIKGGRFEGFEHFEGDEDPSVMLAGVQQRTYAKDRIRRPAVRKSVLEKGFVKAPKHLRGKEEFVEISWEKAFELVANELKRVYESYGAHSIYGGSYGWFCVGSVNNPQVLLYRMLNTLGGFTTRSLNYSCHCISAITPYVTGVNESWTPQTSWQNVLDHSRVVVIWGADLYNTNQATWSVPIHKSNAYLKQLKDRVAAGKIRAICIDPVRNHGARYVNAEQVFINPNTDVAMIEAMIYHLIKNDLADEKFLKKYTVGFKKLRSYILDNEHSPEWAERITGVSAAQIRELAELFASNRTMLMAGWGMQRAQFGEQPHWALISLAAVLGQIGLDGGGYGFCYHDAEAAVPSAINYAGLGGISALPAGIKAPENASIPVSRIVDMLENPGKEYDFNGKKYTFPDIRCIYWAGGNPLHHHQDRNRQKRAFAKAESFIVQDCYWTASARFADLVLPATTEIERNDITRSNNNYYIFAIKQAIKPLYEARNDYDIFCGILRHFGEDKLAAFTEGRSHDEWVRYFYEAASAKAQAAGQTLPSFDEFWQKGYVQFHAANDAPQVVKMKDFRADPITHRLGTPSGKIELFSKKIESFNYADCIGHMRFYEPREWLGNAKKGELNLITPHPRYRLHSQLNNTAVRDFEEVSGREAMWMHPSDAAARGIKNGDIVRVHNARGAILAGVLVTELVKPGVVRMQEGSWYSPQSNDLCEHGDVNVLIADIPSSKLACGNQASALVRVELYKGEIKPVGLFDQPKFARK